MCSTDNKPLLIYTSNDNQTYVGNIFRVLSLPHGYVISFPYQIKYIDTKSLGISDSGDEEEKIKKETKKILVDKKKYKEAIIFFSNAKYLHNKRKRYGSPSSCFIDIPIRKAKIIDIRFEETSKSFIFDLELSHFLIDKKEATDSSNQAYIYKCICGKGGAHCPHHINPYQGKRTLFVIANNHKDKEDRCKEYMYIHECQWHETIEKIEKYFAETAVFYKLERICKKDTIVSKILKKIKLISIPILLLILASIFYCISIDNIILILAATIFIPFIFSILKFHLIWIWPCSKKTEIKESKSFYDYIRDAKHKLSKIFKSDKTYIHPKRENLETQQTLFELKENSNYFVTLHTHFNKNHPDYKKGQNYFIYPTQTDSILSGNIEERIYVNNTYMSLDIPFETNYLDIHQDASYLIFRIYKTLNPQRETIGLPPTINQGTYLDTEALYHLDAPIRVRVVKPWYKVPLVAGILTLLKVMLTPVFKGKEFHWDTFKNNFWECCDIEKGIAQSIGCYWDDVVVTFIAFTIILTLIHYIFKSFTPGHSRIHHQ